MFGKTRHGWGVGDGQGWWNTSGLTCIAVNLFSSTLLSFCTNYLPASPNWGRRPVPTAAKTLTIDKYLTQPHHSNDDNKCQCYCNRGFSPVSCRDAVLCSSTLQQDIQLVRGAQATAEITCDLVTSGSLTPNMSAGVKTYHKTHFSLLLGHTRLCK